MDEKTYADGSKETTVKPPARKKKKKKSFGQILAVILLVLFFFASLTAVLYPKIADYVAKLEKSGIQTQYEEEIEQLDTSRTDEAWAAAQAYNQRLAGVVSVTSDEADALSQQYPELLNIMGNGLMCYVDIPIIDVYLPVYHGNNPDALELGVEHLYGTSLPVGGESTHCALSAHTGLASEKMFTDLESMEIGDVFYIHVLGETLAYQVDSIDIVLPSDVSKIKIEKGKDFVTLITCTPYAVNTHRLLVRGTRIPYEEAQIIEQEIEETKTVTSSWDQQYLKGILAGIAILAILVILYFVIKAMIKRAKKCKAKREKETE